MLCSLSHCTQGDAHETHSTIIGHCNTLTLDFNTIESHLNICIMVKIICLYNSLVYC